MYLIGLWSCVASLPSSLALLPDQIMELHHEFCNSLFFPSTFSPRNSPTFKSFEEKVETTVTSLKVKVRGRVTVFVEVWQLNSSCHLYRRPI